MVRVKTLHIWFRSSVGQSNGLLSRGSQVRILPGAPKKETGMRFCGYDFIVEEDGTIIFDKEVTLRMLDLEMGDTFFITRDENTGQVVLKRDRKVNFDVIA